MTIKEIVENVIKPGDITVHYYFDKGKEQIFSTRILTAAESKRVRNKIVDDCPLGVYLLNQSYNEVYALFQKQSKYQIDLIQEKMKNAYCIENGDMGYLTILFMILHEFGHWKHFCETGLTGEDYWRKYGLQEDGFIKMYYAEMCSCPENKISIEKEYEKRYRNLPMEAIADNYAIMEIMNYM